MKKLLVLIVLASLPALAAPPAAVLSWTAPTLNTDGTAIVGTLTYNVYQGTSPTGGACALGTTAVQTGVAALTVTLTGFVGGTTACFAITAMEGGVESAKSNTSTKTFPLPQPNPPTGLTVN